ncbi:MAG: AraC family ligand binding domain-containing protein [Clostridia bacterium]|nr:AraC family ligand binding domain-containing protein [Clostridia bacterium]
MVSPRWNSAASLLRGYKITCENVVCRLLAPAEMTAEQLCANEVFEVDLVTDGSGECRVFGQAIPCKKGDIFVIPPDIPHNCFVSEKGAEMHTRRM